MYYTTKYIILYDSMFNQTPDVSELSWTSSETLVAKWSILEQVWKVLQWAMKILDRTINGKNIEMFEQILKEIADMPNFYREKFDKDESYFPKLLEIFEVENEIKLILSETGFEYSVEWCDDTIFTRLELEKIGDRFTQIKFWELL